MYKIKKESWDWHGAGKHFIDLPLPALRGEHQLRNASSALQVLDSMSHLLPVSERAIHEGLKNVSLDGRFQTVEGDFQILLDVGHNPLAARVLVDFLKQAFPGKRIHALFTMMNDKDFKGVIETMKPVIYDWYISPLKNPRTANENDMLDAFQSCSVDNVNSGYADFSEAFAAAKANIENQDLLVIFGSFFLVSEFLAGQQT